MDSSTKNAHKPYANVPKMGVFKPGWKQNAKGQSKKMASQMTDEELDYLTFRIRDTNFFKIHPHLLKKKERGLITFDILTIQRMFKSKKLRDQIKEYSESINHEGRVDHRVLIRSNKREKVYIKGKGYQTCNLVFVISLDTKEIITAYYANKNYRFTRVNEARYDENLKIMDF